MLIDWCDTLHFDLRSDGQITREDLTTPLPDDDLCTRAARALQHFSGCASGVHIGVLKSVPAQAGMGGGSSDAASTLLALNRLWGCNLPLKALAKIGLALGADVPFFLGGSHAWVEGIGEKLTPLTLPKAQYVVVKPNAGLDTTLIFSDPQLKRDSEPAILYGFAATDFENKLSTLSFGQNDLQAVAQRLCPGVSDAIAWLSKQGRMTGSGSAVFAHLPQGEICNVAALPDAFQVKLCSSMEAHPLVGWAASVG
jgi:4-diphosphocytidyl-2-C-methyl-D-erythritol kinase